MKKIVIFDFDGVFWDSEYIWVSSLCHILEHYRKNITLPRAFNMFAGTSYKTKRDIILEKYGIDISDPKNKEMIKTKEKELLRGVTLTDGMEKVLSYLDDIGVQMCIATGAPLNAALSRLQKWGLERYFSSSNIVTAKDIELFGGKDKPKPDIFLYAVKQMGYQPEFGYRRF